MTSDLALAVHRALNDAGILVPSPQSDPKIAGASPAARAALAGVEKKP